MTRARYPCITQACDKPCDPGCECGVGPEDDLTWSAIDQGQRDMEFQFLSDSNARSIMAAFQMSPEELPGLEALSRALGAGGYLEEREP